MEDFLRDAYAQTRAGNLAGSNEHVVRIAALLMNLEVLAPAQIRAISRRRKAGERKDSVLVDHPNLKNNIVDVRLRFQDQRREFLPITVPMIAHVKHELIDAL